MNRKKEALTNQGFASNVSPTITPSAPVSLLFNAISSQVLTFPLLTTGIPNPRSTRSLTTLKSAAPARLRRAETCRACNVIQEAPCAANLDARSDVWDVGVHNRNFVEIGTERDFVIDET